jgi:hypothetical protein
MKPARAAAVVTWVYAAGFGGTALPASVYLLRVFWLGFALPFPWLAGAARAVLLATVWKSLAESHGSEARSEATRRPPLAVPDLA